MLQKLKNLEWTFASHFKKSKLLVFIPTIMIEFKKKDGGIVIAWLSFSIAIEWD